MWLNYGLKDLLCPVSISYYWSFGFVLGMLMVVQIVTGFVVSMFFSAGDAYYSVFYFCRETLTGESFRFLHANGVSGIFLALYLHVFRGVGFSSFFLLPVWFSGLILFLLLIIISFLGYSLPWAQMSFWAATVITNLVTSIPEVGTKIVLVLWGDFSVSFFTLNRFYSLHFLLPFVVLALMVVHILLLHLIHTKGPIQVKGDSTVFFPGFWIKDIWLFLIMISLTFFLSLYMPVWLMESDMFLESNPMSAPEHIVPEWYFLPFYAVLRGVPSKLGGVVAMLGVFVCLFLLSFSSSGKSNPVSKVILVNLLFIWLILFWVGGLPVVYPYDSFGMLTVFLFFVGFIPALFYQSVNSLGLGANFIDWILEFIFFLVLVTGFGSSLIYLFLLCTLISIFLLSIFSGLYDSWFVVLVSYLFFGGIMCVLAYFSSFSFSSVRFSGFGWVGLLLLTCTGIVLNSKRFQYSSMMEVGFSWSSMQLLGAVSCTMLLAVMFSVLSVNKEGWGGVRVFSL